MINLIRRTFRGPRRELTVEERLKRYLGFSEGLIALGFFSYAIRKQLNFESYFGDRDLTLQMLDDPAFWPAMRAFLAGEWPMLLFAFFVVGWFFLYRAAVKNELVILSELYSRTNPPKEWEKMLGVNLVPILALGLTLAFVGLAWTIDRMEIFCIIMLLLSVQDAFGNNTLRENIVTHFLQPQFDPDHKDRHGPFILERRQVALDYWVWKPQLARIGLMMIGTVFAFLAATSRQVFGVSFGEYTPHVLIAGIIIANEITMDRWRTQRDRALEDIDKRQKAAEAGLSKDQPSGTV